MTGDSDYIVITPKIKVATKKLAMNASEGVGIAPKTAPKAAIITRVTTTGTINYTGQTLAADGKTPIPNTAINFRWAATQGPSTYVGTTTSDSTGTWKMTLPVKRGTNTFWIAFPDGTGGQWTGVFTM